jgi:hypothetical protein
MVTFMRGRLSTQPLAVRAASAWLYRAAAHRPAPLQEGYVPGLHQTALARLAAHGYHTSVQLMGAFLLRARSREEFCKLLLEAGMEKACVAAASPPCFLGCVRHVQQAHARTAPPAPAGG